MRILRTAGNRAILDAMMTPGRRPAIVLVITALSATAIGCSPAPQSAAAPTAADAKAFLDHANATTLKLGIEQSQASWVQQTFITDDTEALAARANQAANEAGATFARESMQYDQVQVPADERRQLNLLKASLVLATPSDPGESDELSKIVNRIEADGRDRDPRLLRAAVEVARPTARGQADWLVASAYVAQPFKAARAGRPDGLRYFRCECFSASWYSLLTKSA